jgi:hypothetical protein
MDKVPRHVGQRAAAEPGALAVDLRKKIEAAFGDGPPPEEPLVEPGYLDPLAQGDEGATAFFSGKRWNELPPRGLRFHESAMYMFTPEVHRYYLPAFTLLSLDDPETADIIPDNMLFHFSQHKDPFWWARIRILTPAQCDVMADFFAALGDDFSQQDVDEAKNGLARAKTHC